MRASPVSALFLVAVAALFIGCESDPQDTPVNPEAGAPIAGSPCAPAPPYTEDLSGCAQPADDYQPRAPGVDTWPVCISDDDTYHPIEESVSSIARVAAYGTIAAELWVDHPEPTKQDFLDMRILFEEDQGLGSRVARRYDIHHVKPAEGGCDEEGVADANPDYCVGPSKLQPIVTEAFADDDVKALVMARNAGFGAPDITLVGATFAELTVADWLKPKAMSDDFFKPFCS